MGFRFGSRALRVTVRTYGLRDPGPRCQDFRMPRVSQDHLDARRRQILDGSRVCFARYGYEGATVRRLEEATGLSRGAIFHHFRDKESLFLALAGDDAIRMADVVAEQGLVQVMRDLLAGGDHPADWLGTRLEVSRRLRTDPEFRARRAERAEQLTTAHPRPPPAPAAPARGRDPARRRRRRRPHRVPRARPRRTRLAPGHGPAGR